jgi:hypothetical protein
MLHRIMEHTAHHLDVTVPLYHLGRRQADLERHCADLVVSAGRPRSFIDHIRICKLYRLTRAGNGSISMAIRTSEHLDARGQLGAFCATPSSA